FGTDAMRAAAGIAAKTGDEYRQLQKVMGQTSATDSAAQRMDNLAGDMEIFRSVVESLKIQIGDQFQPALRDMFQAATSGLSTLAPIVVDFVGKIGTGISAAIDRTRDYKAEFDKVFAEMGGDKLGGLLAGAAMLTGGKVEIDAEAQVLSVDWENFLDAGSLNFVYSRDAGIEHVDWESKTGKSNFTYDADAQIIDVNYNERLFNYYRDYKADVEIINVAWGTYTHNYDAGANIDETKVLWGAYTHNYDALATVSQDNVLWGIWTHSYNAKAEVGQNDIVWGLWTWTYGAGAEVKEKSVLWGAYSHTYDVAAQVAQSSVLWGAYTHIYDGFAKIGQDSVLWGLWTTTYSVGAQVSGDSVLWGLWTNTYDAKAEIGSSSVLWGAWTWTYGAGASIAQDAVDWGPWSNIYDAAVNIDWPEVPAIFKWLFGWENEGGTPTPSNTSRGRSGGGSGANTNPNAGGGGSRGFGNNASGTNFWEGGWTWVGEQGPELLNLPRGSRIMSNPDSKKMIGQLAQGTGTPTGGIFDGLTQTLGFLASAFGSLTAQQEDLKESVAQNTDAVTTAADMEQMAAQTAQSAAATNATTLKTAGDLIRVSAQQFAMAATQSGSFVLNGVAHFTDSFQELLSSFGDNLEGALQNVPGLFGASQVTGDQMRMAELGIPQNFADDWLRRLTDEVVNGVDWDNVDIQDAAKRAGIDPNLPADAILELVTKAWNDRSLFADKSNLDLFNVEAIQAELMRQQASQAGTANIMALFGVSEDQVTQAGVSAGKQVRAGVTQGLQTSAEGDGT
ncbi:MAG: phage tail tape measure protein, partial [Candidatus Competibacteraceae bacterium]|nr:phage tail tape measure protein [Candidatus Competibacteraceae bacterium]